MYNVMKSTFVCAKQIEWCHRQKGWIQNSCFGMQFANSYLCLIFANWYQIFSINWNECKRARISCITRRFIHLITILYRYNIMQSVIQRMNQNVWPNNFCCLMLDTKSTRDTKTYYLIWKFKFVSYIIDLYDQSVSEWFKSYSSCCM